jgi:hypothetical protein
VETKEVDTHSSGCGTHSARRMVGALLFSLPELDVEMEMEIDDSTFVGQRSQGWCRIPRRNMGKLSNHVDVLG